MENNDNNIQASEKLIHHGMQGINTEKLRDIHINIESIYETLKNSNSSSINKMIFFYLFSVCAISFILHIFIFKFSFGAIFLFLLVLYYFYFNYNIKMSLKKNIKTKSPVKIEPEEPEFLKARIQYVSEGVKVLSDRSKMLRTFYMIFFPLLTFVLIDIIKGPLTLSQYLISFILSIAIGVGVWYYYFNLELTDINSDLEALGNMDIELLTINKN
jgi:Ca2+/Na+ antiporter